MVAAKAAECATEEVALLERVIAQDVDESGETPSIKKEVAKDRVPSVQDPDMRHGRKSSGKTFNGHKAHVAVETDTGLVTAVEVTDPQTPDGHEVRDLVEQTEIATGQLVDEALGDCAYGSAAAHKQADKAKIILTTKMPNSRRGGLFGPGDFEVCQDGKTATCPAGHRSAKVYKAGRKGLNHRWSPAHCGKCPLRDQCLDLKRGSKRRHPACGTRLPRPTTPRGLRPER